MRTGATLKKISEHLNISISTVSRALKDHPDISADTKKRVNDLATLLDYEPNAFAVNLRKRHSHLFAIIVPEISHFYYHSFIQAVEEDSRRLGYSVMILQSMNNPEIEALNLRLCRHNHVAGVFVALTSQTQHFEPFHKMEAFEIPLIFFDKVPAHSGFNKVSIADEACGQLAAKKLLNGRRDSILAVMGNQQLSITKQRLKGFASGCAQLAPEVPMSVAYADNAEDATGIIEQYFQQPQQHYTAIFAMSDEIMCGVIKGLAKLEIKLPSKASLIAISNGFLPLLFTPEVNFIQTSGYDLGKLCFTRMMDMIGGNKEVFDSQLEAVYFPGATI